jgi:hypothetical protein
MEGEVIVHNHEKAKFGFIWCCGFREDLNLKVYEVQMPNDGKSNCHLAK